MNKKLAGIIAAIAVIVIISTVAAFQFSKVSTQDNQNQTDIKIAGEDKPEDIDLPISEEDIQKKLDEIELKAKNYTYTPPPREWISSGPFQIDRSKYALGEKIFITAGGISPNEKGQVAFLRPLNDTHYSVYMSIPFDGLTKDAFNFYLEPKLSETRNICAKDDLIGKWAVVFRGTSYPNLYFDIVDQILPGDEDKYNTPVC